MLRRAAALTLAILVSLALAYYPPRATRADVGVVSFTVALSAVAKSPFLNLQGQGACQFRATGGATGLTATVQVSNDPTYSDGSFVTSGLGSGTITGDGSTGGSVTTATIVFPTAVRINTTAISGGTETVQVTCGPTTQAAIAGTVTVNTPAPAPTDALGRVLVSTPPPNQVDSSATPHPAIFADNPSNASCNGSTALVPCALSTTGATCTKAVAGVASDYVFITGISLGNTSASTVTIAFYSGTNATCASDVLLRTYIIPTLGGNNPTDVSPFNPLYTKAAADNIYYQVSSGVSTVYINLTIAIAPAPVP